MNFADIKGQHRALTKIQADIKKNRLPGAYLFTGPPGVGKKMGAISFAKAVNCKKNITPGCDKCSSCIKVEKNNHPNLRIISPEGESVKIGQIRNLKVEAGYRIYEGNRRVWIIDEAEKLTQEAANSLLKIMEEPPSRLILILITHLPQSLPTTILSRCRNVQFSALSPQQVGEILAKKVALSEDVIPVVAQLAQGSVSEALRLAQNKDMFKQREAILQLITEKASRSSEVFGLAERWQKKEAPDIETLLNMVLFFLRDLLMLKAGSRVIFHQDKRDELSRIKNSYSFSQLYEGIQAVEETKKLIQANVSSQLAIEGMWMRIIYSLHSFAPSAGIHS